MPPKKSSDIVTETAKRTKERAPRKRPPKVKQEKPNPKIPTVAKLKLPPIKSLVSSAPTQNLSPAKVKNKNDQTPELSDAAKRKIELANEVALAQLNSSCKILFEEDVKKKPVKRKLVSVKVEATEKVVRKRGRPKKQIQNAELMEVTSEIGTYTTEESAVVPKKRKVAVTKSPVKRTRRTIDSSTLEVQSNATSKRKADSTSTPIATKRKYVKKKTVNVKEKVHSQQDVLPNTCNTKTKTKGKILSKNISTTDIQSPSILDAENKIIPETSDASKPALIYSRGTSSECLSWTKDISLSSTTATMSIGSNEFVRIDKKLPVLRLSHVENEWRNVSNIKSTPAKDFDSESSCSSSSSSSSSSDAQCPLDVRSLNLSTGSISSIKSCQTSNNSVQSSVTKDADFEYVIAKISANKKKIDFEAIKWVEYDKQSIDPNKDIRQDEIFKLFKDENELLRVFKKNPLKKISQNQSETRPINDTTTDPNIYTDKSEEDDNFITSRSKYVPFDQTCQRDDDPLLQPEVCEPTYEGDYYQEPFEQSNNDDDDALSLFAESITGIESNRYNSSANSVCANASQDEYVPQPLTTNQLYNPLKYVPTKISEDETQNIKNKTVCEKQNADSTSIYRESNKQTVPKDTVTTYPSVEIKKTLPQEIKLIALQYKPLKGVKSSVFRGVCFYNLISKCKKNHCLFLHREPNDKEVMNRLLALTEQAFIEEYMLLRNWPNLRRRYGKIYVSQCIDRKMIRLLLEMIIDFTMKAKNDSVEDAVIKVNVIERALMQLNNVDLNECEDLLQFNFGQNILLCDVLMQAIGETQNFSRFKSVFIKLTNFVIGIGRSFHLNVANQILQFVCILPCEESLALAMLAILKNTDPKVFGNSMILKFEEQLLLLDFHLYDELCSLKELASVVAPAPVLQESVPSPHASQEVVNQQLSLMQIDREERYTSPDTTKMDNLNKAQDKPIEQTVQISYSSLNPFGFKTSSASTDSTEEKRPTKFRNWRGNNKRNSPYKHANMGSRDMYRNRRPLLTQPMLQPLMDQRSILYGPTPPKFPRRPGPGPYYY